MIWASFGGKAWAEGKSDRVGGRLEPDRSTGECRMQAMQGKPGSAGCKDR